MNVGSSLAKPANGRAAGPETFASSYTVVKDAPATPPTSLLLLCPEERASAGDRLAAGHITAHKPLDDHHQHSPPPAHHVAVVGHHCSGDRQHAHNSSLGANGSLILQLDPAVAARPPSSPPSSLACEIVRVPSDITVTLSGHHNSPEAGESAHACFEPLRDVTNCAARTLGCGPRCRAALLRRTWDKCVVVRLGSNDLRFRGLLHFSLKCVSLEAAGCGGSCLKYAAGFGKVERSERWRSAAGELTPLTQLSPNDAANHCEL
jgi:hypothetical protein